MTCKQTIANLSDKPISLPLEPDAGRGRRDLLDPLTPDSRFPKNYLMYGPGSVMDFQPEDPSIRVRDGFLEISARRRPNWESTPTPAGSAIC